MKLQALRLQGFKSFADPVEIEFHSGITAIVGPNGCGKSNISDAIRWVLGEQRPSVIRGARMDEAIFQGSVHRRPVNRGAVSMRVSNEDGTLSVPFEEVEIGRVVYRDGGSEYRINRSTCRLKDVVELCRDTGLGADAYAVIEHRMIDAILSDRAEERRALFEEASGVGKYKDRRKSAVRRLERAELDLQRLEDVIGEVESKVRSLARQKGKAVRWRTLRDRRLSVEMAVVRNELEGTARRLDEVQSELERDRVEVEGKAAELQATETKYEKLRLDEADAERERGEAAAKFEELRQAIVRWERELAVAKEQGRSAGDRLVRIETERAGARDELEGAEVARGALAERLDALEDKLTEARRRAAESGERAEAVRTRLVEARNALDRLEEEGRAAARRGALLEGEAEASEEQASELERRIADLSQEIERANSEVTEIESQGDLFSDRLVRIEGDADAVRVRVSTAEEAVAEARSRASRARDADRAAFDRHASVRAAREALERVEEEGEGVEPAARALMESRIGGILGPLAHFIEAGDVVEPLVRYLGPMAAALVVRDSAVIAEVRDWFEEHWAGSGGLVLLPLDRVPEAGTTGSLLERVEPKGEGAPWVRALLAGVDLVDDDEVLTREGVAVGGSRLQVDRMGIVRLGHPAGGGAPLGRRERLDDLRREEEEASEAAREARATRDAAEEALVAAEVTLAERREELHSSEEELRKARSEAEDRVDARARADRRREELSRQVEGTRATRDRLLARARAASQEREQLEAEAGRLRTEAGDRAEKAEAIRAEWDAAAREASDRGAELAILESEGRGLGERREELESRIAGLRGRLEGLDREEESRRNELERAERVGEEGARELERLFGERDGAEVALRQRTEALTAIRAQLTEAEAHARRARAEERSTVDRRHRLELERQELESRVERIRDRVEAEWHRPLEQLLEEVDAVVGEPDALREELLEIVQQLDRIGPVNMLAVEEHEEESRRLDFLREQHDDLVEARDDLRSAIREINRTATSLFTETFEQIRARFRETFERLFEGGEADLWLEDPEDPLESPIEIHASPRGKRTQRIDLLSGGERALTALSLLFGIYLVKPSPFCVLDEVDAPLDEANIGRFIRLLEEFKGETQFVVITHNPRTIEAADWIYGVTMEEPGISSIVGVRLEEALGPTDHAA